MILLFQSEKFFSWVCGSVFILIIIAIVSWFSFYKIWYKIKDKRTNFMNGVRTDITRAVSDYEKLLGSKPANDPKLFGEWKNKYNYIREFTNFPYSRLKLEKEYIAMVNKFYRYLNQQNI